MRALPESFALFMPPWWLAAAAAALAAVALLVAFVDTLHENVRRGETLRQWQRVGPVRQPLGVVTAAAPAPQAQQSGASVARNLPR